jgi:hypothetical protein
MGDEQFDEMAKAAGNGIGRRKMLKLLAGTAVGGVLAKVGLDHLERTGTSVTTIETTARIPDGALIRTDSVIDPAILTSETVLPTAHRISQSAIASAQLNIDEHLPVDRVCAALLEEEARVIATFTAMIARYPKLKKELMAEEKAAVKVITTLLHKFGCPGISTVVTTTTTTRPTTTTTAAPTTTTRPTTTTTTSHPRGTCCQVYVFGVPSCCCSDKCHTGVGSGCSTSTEFFRCAPTFFSCSFATAVSFACFSGTCNTKTGKCRGA